MKAYKKRMVKEYKQLHKRIKKLQKFLIKYEVGTLKFSPNTQICVLERQLRAMNEYCRELRIRAELEGIDLEY